MSDILNTLTPDEKDNFIFKNDIIFLDIDGVLNSTKFFLSSRFNPDLEYPYNSIDPVAVETLNTLFGRLLDCKIILSSSWSMESILLIDSIRGEFIGRTPYFPNKIRGKEIDYVVKENNISSYAIIDDDKDMLFSQRSRFVYIDREYGLQPHHINKIINILKKKS